MAGFFGLFDYTKPGPGISKDEPQKRRFFLYFEILFSKFWKLIILNLLYVLFCIPIITIGPATAAMFYVLRNYNQRKHVFLPGDFLDSFKRNFKQGLIIWILDILAVLIIAFNFSFWTGDTGMPRLMSDFAFAILIFISATLVFMNFYIYTLISSFYMTVKQVIKNSFIFATIGIFRNILIALIVGAIALVSYIFYGIAVIFAIFILFTFTAYTVSFIIFPVIKRYLIDPVMEEERKKEEENAEDEEFLEESVFEDKG